MIFNHKRQLDKKSSGGSDHKGALRAPDESTGLVSTNAYPDRSLSLSLYLSFPPPPLPLKCSSTSQEGRIISERRLFHPNDHRIIRSAFPPYSRIGLDRLHPRNQISIETELRSSIDVKSTRLPCHPIAPFPPSSIQHLSPLETLPNS